MKLTPWGDVCGWLPLFRRLERGNSAAQDVAPLSKGSLESLEIEHFLDPVVDASLVSPIQMFGTWSI